MTKLLNLIAMGHRARRVTIGVDRVREDIRAGRTTCVVVAEDASARAFEKVVRLALARDIPVVRGPAADRLGAQLGKPPVMVVGLKDRSLTDGVLQLELEAVCR